MPENLRALIVILVLSTIVFAFVHRPACAVAGTGEYTRKRNLWYALTLAAFLSYSFWIYTLIAIPLLLYAARRETNIPALFFFTLFVLPVANISVPGMGLINYFIDLSHLRLLELFVLLPAFLALIWRKDIVPFGRLGSDVLLVAYLALAVLLSFRIQGSTITSGLRYGFYMFIDGFLPYFVVSRSLKSLQHFRVALLSFVLSAMVCALVAVFEFAKPWPLYQGVLDQLGLVNAYGGVFGGYLMRAGMLRATATAGQPIALGYLIVVGLGLYLFLQQSIKPRSIRWLGMALLTAGLIASLSRGPWVGAVALLVFFFATGRNAAPRLIGFVLAAVFAFFVITILPGGEKVINLLPFVGTTEAESIVAREELLEVSIRVFELHPWLGSADFLDAPKLQALRTGLGIVDVVNSYIRIALETGALGLSLFVGFFALTVFRIFLAMRSVRETNSEERLLGRVLLTTLLAILLIIFTVSSITIVPVVYWSVAGMGVAYVQIVRNRTRMAIETIQPEEKTSRISPLRSRTVQ